MLFSYYVQHFNAVVAKLLSEARGDDAKRKVLSKYRFKSAKQLNDFLEVLHSRIEVS